MMTGQGLYSSRWGWIRHREAIHRLGLGFIGTVIGGWEVGYMVMGGVVCVASTANGSEADHLA